MNMPEVISCGFLSLAALAAGTVALAQTQYSPGIDAEYPRNLYWGDTHRHTRNSPDAFSLGNMNLSQADAYRFAMGQELRTHNGMRVRLKRPLDFLVVSDHSEHLGGYFRFALQDRKVWTRAISGTGSKPTNRQPGDRPLRFLTTRTSRTESCFPT